MTFEIEISGRVRSVAIETTAGRSVEAGEFTVRVDGIAADVTVRRTDLGFSIVFLEDGRSVDVAVSGRAGGEYLVQLPHVSVGAVLDGRRRRGAGTGATAGTGEQRILAPMPGRVVRVLVQVGDQVAARQGVVVVEAMKMENELVVLRPGRVREVAVTEGTSVEAGRLLVVVE